MTHPTMPSDPTTDPTPAYHPAIEALMPSVLTPQYHAFGRAVAEMQRGASAAEKRHETAPIWQRWFSPAAEARGAAMRPTGPIVTPTSQFSIVRPPPVGSRVMLQGTQTEGTVESIATDGVPAAGNAHGCPCCTCQKMVCKDWVVVVWSDGRRTIEYPGALLLPDTRWQWLGRYVDPHRP